MFLENLKVFNFRNLNNQEVKFKPGTVVFYGDNAQGKTNLLEAIYLLSTTKSFRTRIDHHLLRWGEEKAAVKGRAEPLEIELFINTKGKKLLINKQLKKNTEIIGQFVAVVFTPSDIEIINGGPEKRRRFLDQLCSTLSRKYLKELVSFNKLLRSRNQALFLLKQGRKADLWVWDEQLAKSGAVVWEERFKRVKQIAEKLKKIGKKITLTNLSLDYKNPFGLEIRVKTQDAYLKKLEQTRNQDINHTFTSFGPHRDDFQVVVEEENEGKIVSKDIGIYGSRGEQRSAALVLKISELEIIEEEKNLKPTLLLDEVFSELDNQHRNLLLRSLKANQVFITTTDLEALKKIGLRKPTQVFKVSCGEVVPER